MSEKPPEKENPTAIAKSIESLAIDGPPKKDSEEDKNLQRVVANFTQSNVDSSLVVERRTFQVGEEARQHFENTFTKEVLRKRTCSFPIKKGKYAKKKQPCGELLVSLQQALTHLELHLMFDITDPRTQLQAVKDTRELVYPLSEKTERAALPAQERQRMLKEDKYLQRRLASKAETS